jgi:hypothetical protein
MSKKKDSKAAEAVVPVEQMLPAMANELANYAEHSAADVLDAERVMPVLLLIQHQSKVLIKGHEKFVSGAEAGMILNRATGMLKPSVVFVPCARQHCYVEWVPMAKGGGKVGTYPLEDARVAELRKSQGFGKLTTPDGNEIHETFYVYGYVLDDSAGEPVPEPAVLAVKSSSITPYKQFFNNVRSFLLRDAEGNLVRTPDGKPINPPMFAHKVRISAVPKSKDGNDFHIFKFEPANGTMAESLVAPGMLAFGRTIAEDFAAGRTRVEEEDDAPAAAKEGTSAF